MTPREMRALATPEAVKKLLTKPQSYGNGYQCCTQMIALADELRRTRTRADHSSKHLGEFNKDIGAILRKAGFRDLPSWLEAYQALQAEVTENDASFELRSAADMRAIKMWQEATGKTEVWPDHGKLCVWLLGKIEEISATEVRREKARDGAYTRMCELDIENKKLRTFIEGVREFDPRSDHYANELHGDACEALGLCRCCGDKVCDDA